MTKRLSKEFSRTESRILGALSKLDDFLLNPQVRNCSVAVPRTSRNSNSENRETTGDRFSDDPCPEVRFSSHLNRSELGDYRHREEQWSPERCRNTLADWKHAAARRGLYLLKALNDGQTTTVKVSHFCLKKCKSLSENALISALKSFKKQTISQKLLQKAFLKDSQHWSNENYCIQQKSEQKFMVTFCSRSIKS